ncbi:MAG: O-antigen ligase family protein [Thermomicrobiales bacterium]
MPRVNLAAGLTSLRASVAELATRLGRRRLLAIALVLVLIASPWPPLTIVALVAYIVTALALPGLTVALLPLSAPFAYWPKHFYVATFPVVELLLLVALATTLLWVVMRWQRQARSGLGSAAWLDFVDGAKQALLQPFGLQAAALVLIATFSLITVADPAHRHESLREYRTTVIEPLLYFFLAWYWLRPREPRLIACASFIAGAAIVAALGIGQVLTGYHVVLADGVRRATSVYMHPNNLALYLVRAAAFALALLVLSPTPRRERALYVALPILLIGLALTFSRGAFLGLAVAIAVLGIAAGRRLARVTLLVAAAGGAALLALAATRLNSGSLGLREYIWRSTLAMIRDHPAFGVGLDQFLTQYTPRYVNPAAWGERFTSHPHDFLLDFWVRLGIMGLAWILWLLVSLAVRVGRSWRLGETGERRLLVAAPLACVAALVHGTIDNFYFLIDLAFSWWLLLALLQIATVPPAGAGAEASRISEPVEGW